MPVSGGPPNLGASGPTGSRCSTPPTPRCPACAFSTWGCVMTDSTWEEQCRRADERAKKAREKKERRDPYEVLGVQRDASLEQIKKAYRKRVKEWHPDRHPTSKKDECTQRIIEINAAYEILSDP